MLRYYYSGWSSQCWKKHNSGSIQTPDGEFKRPFGILCTYQCFLWFPPVFPYCEFIFDLRMSRHFTSFPDCYAIHCNETKIKSEEQKENIICKKKKQKGGETDAAVNDENHDNSDVLDID
uniref:Uncharacterized protein n=1 Tax=Glossina brevipalpis TaxID=37001 RepID=A0A1A9WV73_9MUSC